MLNIGSRCKVMHGNANKTSGGLKKEDLMYNKQGKIVSKKMSKNAKKENRLEKAGFITKKGIFGTIQMKGGDNTPPGTPVKTRNNPSRPPPLKGSFENRLINAKQNAIVIAINMGFNLKPANMIAEREYANPANAVFIDKINKKVYKIGLWSKNNERSIEKECMAYTKLMNKYPNDANVHYPKMYGCMNIPNTEFGILILEYMVGIAPNNIKNKNNIITQDMKKSINEYLATAGIIHNDLDENLFIYKPLNKPSSILVMDFEDVTFIDNNKKNLKKNNITRSKGLFGNNNNNI